MLYIFDLKSHIQHINMLAYEFNSGKREINILTLRFGGEKSKTGELAITNMYMTERPYQSYL